MCCLGVLCKVQGATPEFLEAHKFKLELGEFNAGTTYEQRLELANLNDGEDGPARRFKWIADHIAKHL
jgi:hypothetical protein